jgi:hypothetical protein
VRLRPIDRRVRIDRRMRIDGVCADHGKPRTTVRLDL